MRLFTILFFLVVSLKLSAQNNSKEVLFTVDEDPVYASEFIRVFNKNLDLVKDESQKDIDAYLKLFVGYKLKLKEAKTLGLDTVPKYKRELSNYRSQLAKNYLSDNKVTDALVEEAYERISNEVDASHILIRLDENANPSDTLKVYNKLVELRERVLKEGFATVQKEVHDGKEVYAEDLGYFSGFKMVYPFETVAFNTEIGTVSMPFKTQFGYHIVYVKDKRKSRGKREIAHIMVNLNQADAESRIQDIYKKIEQGEDFESLAKHFSEDKSTANKGGKLSPFSSGELRSKEFEDQAFAIENEGDYTKPFKSNFGWHIVKLIHKIETAPFEDMKASLEAKVLRDSRSKLISNSRINELKQRYAITNVDEDLNYFTSILNATYYISKWHTPEGFEPEKAFVKIEDQQFTYQDFANFLIKNQRRNANKLPFNEIVTKAYQTFLEKQLLAYQEAHLEFENPDFANILSEYRDGLLLFDLMENEIWKAAIKDTLAVQEYYNNNKENYFFKERVDAVVASSAKKKDISKVAKLLKKGKTIDQIKSIVNTKDQVNVLFTKGIMDGEHQVLPDDFLFQEGVSEIYKHNDAYVVAQVNNVLPKTYKTYEEAKGKVASDFQDAKEKKWLVDLENKYQVKINQEVLNSVKSKLNN